MDALVPAVTLWPALTDVAPFYRAGGDTRRIVPVTAPPVVTVTVPLPLVLRRYPDGAAGDGAPGGNKHVAAGRCRVDAVQRHR